MRARKTYTNDELNTIAVAMVEGKLSYSQIASKVGRSVNSLYQLVHSSKHAGMSKTGDRFRKYMLNTIQNKPKTQDHKTVHTKPQSDKVRPAKMGKLWAAEDVNKLLKLFYTGNTPESMAVKLNRTVGGVLGKLHSEGLLKFDREQMAYFTTPMHYYSIEN